MSSGSLEPGLYHIKSQLSGQYLTVLFPGNGRTIAQPEKGTPVRQHILLTFLHTYIILV